MPADLQTTFIIKTFERPTKLFFLLKSIDKFYPNTPIIIIDDSKKPIDKKWAPHIQYVYTEYDIGLAEGRNRAVKLVKTKYFVLLDDDLEFTQQTKIETFKELLEKYNFDLIGGKFYEVDMPYLQYTGFFTTYCKAFYIWTYKDPGKACEVISVDFTWNFFLAKTNMVKKNLWDSELKIGEHDSFFLGLKDNHVKVGYTPRVIVNHWPDYGKNEEGEIINQTYYDGRVARFHYYLDLFSKKKGIEHSVCMPLGWLPLSLSLPFEGQPANFYPKYVLFFMQFITIRFLHLRGFVKDIRYANFFQRYFLFYMQFITTRLFHLNNFIKNTRYKCLKKMCKILSIDYNRLKKFYWKLTMKPLRD